MGSLATNTAGALITINTELGAIRAMVLQNRLALDILLAKEGGACHMLHAQQCCTYVPDKSSEINKFIIVSHVSKDLKEL